MIVSRYETREISPYIASLETLHVERMVIAPLVVNDPLAAAYCHELKNIGAALFATKNQLETLFGDDFNGVDDEVMRDLGIDPDETDPISAVENGVRAGLIDQIHLHEGSTEGKTYEIFRILELISLAEGRNVQVIWLPTLEAIK